MQWCWRVGIQSEERAKLFEDQKSRNLGESTYPRSGTSQITLNDKIRAKTSLRITYEAQAKVIADQTGDLEQIRLKLGLSSRKMAQLLLVDPSAWTRWTKRGIKAPPHVYRSLQWYLALQEKLPGLSPQMFLNLGFKQAQFVENKMEEKAHIKQEVSVHISDLESQVLRLKKYLTYGLGALGIINLFMIFLLIK